MANEARVNSIIEALDRYFVNNMGQKTIYLKNTIAIIQRRAENNYILYFFDHSDTILGLDIRDSNRYSKFTKDELISFLNEELVEW